MEIKILGMGCAKCTATEKLVKEVLAEAGIQAQVEKVTDLREIAGYGVLGTPAVVVDGQVKSISKVPKKEEILAWVKKYPPQAGRGENSR